jgi:hypothetical protein
MTGARFTQRRGGLQLDFVFTDTALDYRQKCGGVESGFHIPYTLLAGGKDKATITERGPLAWACIFSACAPVAYALHHDIAAALCTVAAAGMFFFVLRCRRHTVTLLRFDYFKVPALVLHDGQRNAIVAAFDSALRHALRTRFLPRNPHAAPVQNDFTLHMLCRAGAISKDEYDNLRETF